MQVPMHEGQRVRFRAFKDDGHFYWLGGHVLTYGSSAQYHGSFLVEVYGRRHDKRWVPGELLAVCDHRGWVKKVTGVCRVCGAQARQPKEKAEAMGLRDRARRVLGRES